MGKNVKAVWITGEVAKADTSTQIDKNEMYASDMWISPVYDQDGLSTLVDESDILPQCITAYSSNICGFGIGVKYKEEDVVENDEMVAEFNKATEIVELLTLESDTMEPFEEMITSRETYGIAYTEVIRNGAGEPEQIVFISDTTTVKKTLPLKPYVEYSFFYKNKEITRKKQFRKYRQDIGGKTVYFKEFGDPRIMDKTSGDYLKDGETIPPEQRANEIFEIKIGTDTYGKVRWIGQILQADGSRKAENLNNNYFENGRHTPLMFMVENGTLTEDSYNQLQKYMEDIKGEAGQHGFMLLEVESTDGRTDFDTKDKPSITVKELGNILQHDELFQNYIENNRKRIQSAFRLPDLYVGYTTDFNRSTAWAAIEVTEKQIFKPERERLAWIINNKLLNAYKFKHVEVYFKEPDLSNPDDLAKILSICNAAGGLTPNKAKEILFKARGEVSEDYDEEWGNIPISIFAKLQQGAMQAPDISEINSKASKIQKSYKNHDDEIVAIMREVKKMLISKSEQENAPTDEQ